MKVSEIAFSCYAVSDMPRARAFYEGVLGLTPGTLTNTEHGDWVEYEIGQHTLTIGRTAGWNPSPDGCMVALEVEDFNTAIAELRASNTAFRMEPFPTPICRMAMILDPDGNTICIHQRNAH